MNIGNLIQLAVSAVAVALLVGMAALMTRGRAAPPLDEAAARRLLAEEFPDDRLESLWLAADGRGGVARAGKWALVLMRIGDGYLARRVVWREAQAAQSRGGRVTIALREPGAPRAVLAFAAWPPPTAKGEAAT
ncbi:hypothetical protein [Phenylobacterium sp.]|uniref:hypothetical protein n=1 Tax=Phenylobacterium sp. TaxID=1871053 RepID=UPI001229235A|nr:hypothetical protein [Phenylobacterium sp.]THD58059.1 MAG: hypothetical protein E8A49_20520 [Phenylobacterium sp.]